MAGEGERGWLEEVNYTRTAEQEWDLRSPCSSGSSGSSVQVSLWADSILHCNGPPGSTAFLPPFLPVFLFLNLTLKHFYSLTCSHYSLSWLCCLYHFILSPNQGSALHCTKTGVVFFSFYMLFKKPGFATVVVDHSCWKLQILSQLWSLWASSSKAWRFSFGQWLSQVAQSHEPNMVLFWEY